eukprot:SAG22_NODE_1456_length_4385_cov_12.667289_3_plen_94_part_00
MALAVTDQRVGVQQLRIRRPGLIITIITIITTITPALPPSPSERKRIAAAAGVAQQRGAERVPAKEARRRQARPVRARQAPGVPDRMERRSLR